MALCAMARRAKRRAWRTGASAACFALVLAMLGRRPADAADWPTYRADITRSGVTQERLGRELALQWSFQPLHAPKPAWPPPSEELPRMHVDNAYHAAIAGGVVYFGSSVTDNVVAIDAASGATRWTFAAEGPVRFAPSAAEGRVYFGSDDGYVYCLQAADGSLIWKYRPGPSDEKVIGNGRMISLWPVRTSVLVDDGVVYCTAGVFPYEGLYVCALEAKSGAVVWKNDTIGDRPHELEFGGISPHGYLLASSQILFVPSGRAMPAAFDRRTGEFLYATSPGGKRGGVWALLDQDRLIAGVESSGAPNKAAYDAVSGRRLGDAFAWFQGIDMAITPDAAYLVTSRGLDAVDRKAYQRATAESKKLDVTIQAQGRELAGLKKEQAGGGARVSDGRLARLIDSVSEKLRRSMAMQKQQKGAVFLWRHPAENLTSVIRAGDLILAGGQDTVVGVDAHSGQEVFHHDVKGRAVGLAAGAGRLIVSTDAGYVYCFGEGAAAGGKTIGMARAAYPDPKDDSTDLYRSAAQRIVAKTGVKKGYCLVLDAGQGRLACELARRTDLQIVGLETDPAKRAAARSRLEAAGLLGWRVVIEAWDIKTLPDYFANLIVSDGMLRSGETSASKQERRRVLRPWGGVEYLIGREQADSAPRKFVRGPLEGAGQWTQQYADPQNTACSGDKLVNGPLGILWYGEPGPQGMVERHARAEAPVAMDGRLFIEGEELILAVDAFNGTLLWKREIPGAVRVKTKADSGNLVVARGGLYVAARDKCYRLDPETGRTLRAYEMPVDGLAGPRRWGYISVVDGVLYGSTASAMNQPYGALLAACLDGDQWKDPDDVPAAFRADYERYKRSYPDPQGLRMAAERSGLMYRYMSRFGPGGEFTQKRAVTGDLMASDRVFALDAETGKLLWAHDGGEIANITIVLGDGKIFFADNAVTAEQRKQALDQRRKLTQAGVYREREGALDELNEKKSLLAKYIAQKDALVKAGRDHSQIDRLIDQASYVVSSLKAEFFQGDSPDGILTREEADVRTVVALDARTGRELWKHPIDLTGCCGDRMGAAYSDGLMLFFGNHGNHDAWRFIAGGLKWRRITALAAATGEMVWSRALNYRTRPVIVGQEIILEPRACDLHTGETVLREHPVTGEMTPWEFLRPGHTCGITAASADGLFYRSACTAFYDLDRDAGVAYFGGYRPGCAISVIPACGVLLSPEAAAGCTCSYPIRCTVALVRKPDRPQPWTVYVAPGDLLPVKHLAINFGAVADMKDDDGTVWFAYPSPDTSRYNHFPNYGVKVHLNEQILPDMGYFSRDFKGRQIAGTDRPWLFTSGCRGLVRCEVPLRKARVGQPGAKYAVRLGFRPLEGDLPNQRVFDIKLQGEVVQKNCDIAKLTGGADQAVVLQFEGVPVRDTLVLELVARDMRADRGSAPVVHFLEVRREE